jgi:hypothetical protein
LSKDHISDMHLDEYVAREGRGTLEKLRRETGLAYTTVFKASRRVPIKTYDAARRISLATGGEVSIAELCAPMPSESCLAEGV